MAQGLRLMAVHAHPDDESSKGAASSARYVHDGVEVMVVSCTGGERGDVLNDKLKHDPEIERDLSQVRRREMEAARDILGVQHTWLGFVDSGLPEGDPLPPLPEGCFALEPLDVTTEALVRVIREFRPHVLTTYDERGGYPHPDHVMTHVVSMAAFQACGDPAAYPHAGPAWQPQKVYYSTLSAGRIRAMHAALLEAGMESPYDDWLKRLEHWPERAVHTHVECAAYYPVRDDALRAHATQVDPDGTWFTVPMDMQQRAYPWEDYELARSFLPPSFPEDDLFAGLPPAAELDEVCTRAPERDGDGQVVVAYRSPLPEPVEEEGEHRPSQPRDTEPVDDEDEMRQTEGHAEDAAS